MRVDLCIIPRELCEKIVIGLEYQEYVCIAVADRDEANRQRSMMY